MRTRFLEVLLVLATLFVAGRAQTIPRAIDPPRLIVVISVDQWCYDYFERFAEGMDSTARALGESTLGSDAVKDDPLLGLAAYARRNGSWFTEAHHRHAYTLTGPGHSVLLTGVDPGRTGIITNDWFDRDLGRSVYCVEDQSASLVVGKDYEFGSKRKADLRVSPRTLLVETLGDRLMLASGGRSKVFGVAIKDRAAILMAGHLANGVYWMSDEGPWITSSAYEKSLPGYMDGLWEKQAKALAGKSWSLSQDIALYRQGTIRTSDGVVAEVNKGEVPIDGMTPGFPHVLPTADHKSFVKCLVRTPFGNDVTFEAAERIRDHNRLGEDDDCDILAINLSSPDYIGHAFGPQSLEVEDCAYRTNAQIDAFRRRVDAKLSKQRWVMVITSDHGVAPIPECVDAHERMAFARHPMGPLNYKEKDMPEPRRLLEAELRERFDVGPWEGQLISAFNDNQIWLNRDHARFRDAADFARAQEACREWLLQRPSIHTVLTRSRILAGRVDGDIETAMARSFQAARSGDVLYVSQPYVIHDEKSQATTHGTPWRYDTHVPLLFVNGNDDTKCFRQIRITSRVETVAIAPTLARLLSIAPPSSCDVPPIEGIVLR